MRGPVFSNWDLRWVPLGVVLTGAMLGVLGMLLAGGRP